MAELSAWLDERGLAASDLSDEVIASFFTTGGGHRIRRSISTLARAVSAICARSASLAPRSWSGPAQRCRSGSIGCLWDWCIDQRGLALVTTDQYVERMAGFLAMWHPHGEAVLSELDGASVLAPFGRLRW